MKRHTVILYIVHIYIAMCCFVPVWTLGRISAALATANGNPNKILNTSNLLYSECSLKITRFSSSYVSVLIKPVLWSHDNHDPEILSFFPFSSISLRFEAE